MSNVAAAAPIPSKAQIFIRRLITTQFAATPYEVTLPRVPWLPEQSYINVQSLQPVKFTEFVRKAPGKFDARILSEVHTALKAWLKL